MEDEQKQEETQVDKELLFKQYLQHMETYKFYLNMVVKIMGGYFAITGAIISFYIANGNVPQISVILYLPTVISIILAVIFSWGCIAASPVREDVKQIVWKLNLDVCPDLIVLQFFLGSSALILLICFYSLFICLLSYPLLSGMIIGLLYLLLLRAIWWFFHKENYSVDDKP